MYRLKSALQSKYSEKEENVTIYTPKNCDTVKLHFRGEKMAKVINTVWFKPLKLTLLCRPLVD
jgi:cleavage and polyadenylation specificity factor subunit 3